MALVKYTAMVCNKEQENTNMTTMNPNTIPHLTSQIQTIAHVLTSLKAIVKYNLRRNALFVSKSLALIFSENVPLNTCLAEMSKEG